MQLTKQELIELLYTSAEKASVPDIGNRADLEQALFGDTDEQKVVDFFNEFGRAYAAKLSQ